MSINLESNTHFSKAKFLQEGVHEWQTHEGQTHEGTTDASAICMALDALIESNLAVAYEQRTANLIALAQMEHRNAGGIGFSPDYDSAAIHERLDLA